MTQSALRRLRLGLAALGATACSHAAMGGTGDRGAEITAFVGVNVIPMDRDTVLRDQTVVVRGGRIDALGAARAVRVPRAAHVILGVGRFLIPGLWDAHVHTFAFPDSGIAMTRRAAELYFPLFIAYGVTGVRDLGSDLAGVRAARADTASGAIGPRLVIAGQSLGGPNRWAGPVAHVRRVTSAAEARLAVDSLAAANVDLIKVHDFLSREAFLAAAEEARRVGKPLVGHLRASPPLLEAVDAGQSGVEHVAPELLAACGPDESARVEAFYADWTKGRWPAFVRGTESLWAGRSTPRCSAVFGELARRGVSVTPTMVLRMQDTALARELEGVPRTSAAAGFCAATLDDWGAVPDSLRSRYYRVVRDVVAAMHESGVRLLAGTDGPSGCLVPGATLHQELMQLTLAGLSPFEALRTATANPAAAMGRPYSGVIRAGADADLVLLEANPLDDIRNTRRIRGVMVRGKFLDRGALDALIAGARKFSVQ